MFKNINYVLADFYYFLQMDGVKVKEIYGRNGDFIKDYNNSSIAVYSLRAFLCFRWLL